MALNPYGMHPKFEQAVVAHAILTGKFYDTIGAHIDPAGLTDPRLRLVLQATKAIAADVGRGGTAAAVVLQRLERWREKGDLSLDELVPARAWLDGLASMELPSWEAVHTEIVPLLRKRMHHDTMREGMTPNADFGKLSKEFGRIETLGDVDTSIGYDFLNFDDEFVEDTSFDQLPTGNVELTAAMDGGLERGQLGFYFGPTGSGKSMALNMQAVAAAKWGRKLNIALATLEIREMPAKQRFISGLLGMSKSRMRSDAAYRRQAANEVARLQLPVKFHTKFFPGKATRVSHLGDWLSDVEDATGEPIDLFLVDYADKLISDHDDEYKSMLYVYEGLRYMAIDRSMWLWTAAQAVRRLLKEGEYYGLNDVADSQHKVRVADVVASITPVGDDQLAFKVCKNREGEKSGGLVGPAPHAFWCGMAMMPRNIDPLESSAMRGLYEH